MVKKINSKNLDLKKSGFFVIIYEMKNKKNYALIVLFLVITLEGVFVWQNKLMPKPENEREEIGKNRERSNEKRLAIKNYKKSLETWEKLKRLNGESYIYKTGIASWAGYKNETKITIKNGIPIAREFQESFMDYIKDAPTPESYSENFENLGTNKKGAPLVTIDYLYKECKQKLRVSSRDNIILFETDDDGIIAYCGYAPLNCSDDCNEGVSINSFEWIK